MDDPHFPPNPNYENIETAIAAHSEMNWQLGVAGCVHIFVAGERKSLHINKDRSVTEISNDEAFEMTTIGWNEMTDSEKRQIENLMWILPS